MTETVVAPSLPFKPNLISWLQQRTHALALSAINEPRPTPFGFGKNLRDRMGFPMGPRVQNGAAIGEGHAPKLCRIGESVNVFVKLIGLPKHKE